jgi:PAS domain S-box-containing protein
MPSQEALNNREERDAFRLLVEAVSDYAIFMLDTHGVIQSWNIGAERINGYKASEIIGKHFSIFYPAEAIAREWPNYELERAAAEGKYEEEGWRLRKDGSRFWANVLIAALRDPDGKLYGFAKVTRDFTERMQADMALREAQARLKKSEKSLRDLSLHLLRTQDEERRRIGRDLHDSLGQLLAVLKMKIDLIKESVTGDFAQVAAECAELAEESIREVRTVSYLLYPAMLEERGLKPAIAWYLEGFTKRSGIQTNLHVAQDFGRLPRDAELALFRVLQESLTNVHRHSGSATADVELAYRDGSAILKVSDHGKGMPAEELEQCQQDWTGALGVGLRGMNERMRQLGGDLELRSGPEGTTITASVPASPQTTKSTTAVEGLRTS